jgi:hypothetical protein
LLRQLVTSLLSLNNLVARCQQAVDSLTTSWEQAVRTHPDDKLLEQHCYKSALYYNLSFFRVYLLSSLLQACCDVAILCLLKYIY